MKLDKEKLKISKESVDKVFTPTEITDEDILSESVKSLEDFIKDAWIEAIKNDIRANTVMISKRLAKVNSFPTGVGDFPPLICGLEAFVTDELPEEFAFGLVEAPMTQREAVFEDGRLTGYNQGYEQGVRDMAERLRKYYTTLPLPKVQPTVVEYTIRVLEEELIGEK